MTVKINSVIKKALRCSTPFSCQIWEVLKKIYKSFIIFKKWYLSKN